MICPPSSPAGYHFQRFSLELLSRNSKPLPLGMLTTSKPRFNTLILYSAPRDILLNPLNDWLAWAYALIFLLSVTSSERTKNPNASSTLFNLSVISRSLPSLVSFVPGLSLAWINSVNDNPTFNLRDPKASSVLSAPEIFLFNRLRKLMFDKSTKLL